MNKTAIFTVLIFMISCNSTEIKRLEKETMKYSSLPIEVKKYIFDVDFKDLNEPNKYYLVSRQDKFLPWVYHSDIHRRKDEKIFQTNLSGEFGYHYVIFKDYLFIPNHYNIYISDSLEYSFTRFQLK